MVNSGVDFLIELGTYNCQIEQRLHSSSDLYGGSTDYGDLLSLRMMVNPAQESESYSGECLRIKKLGTIKDQI